jgi:predicted ATPase
MVLFEDAHWADPSTIEVLSALVDRIEKLALLALITYRPEFQPPWIARPHVTPISLARLSRAQGASIVLRVAEDKPAQRIWVAQIVDKTDGVPLFLRNSPRPCSSPTCWWMRAGATTTLARWVGWQSRRR